MLYMVKAERVCYEQMKEAKTLDKSHKWFKYGLYFLKEINGKALKELEQCQ